MDLALIILSAAALAVAIAALGVCIHIARRPREKVDVEALRAVQEALDKASQATARDVDLLLKGYQAAEERNLAAYETRQNQIGQDAQRNLSEMNDAILRTLQGQRMEMEQKLELIRTGLDAKQAQSVRLTQERLDALRTEVATGMDTLRRDNNKQLEEMRKVVDHDLQENLQTKLNQSFRMISENLQRVAQSMGEMQSMTEGMNDLKRVLSGVKTRGVWGEVSLGALLGDILTPEQYAVNFRPSPHSDRVVEYAVRLPGKTEGASVYLPIDSKFPRENYERMVEASERGDKEGVDTYAKALDATVKKEAQKIHNKYLLPPRTTDFAIMYLPIEGLYAEMVRREGLTETLRTEYHVLIAGPTTLAALLNSLQMGFQTLAVEKRNKEIWKLLRTIQQQFNRFAKDLDTAERQLNTAMTTLHKTGERTQAIGKDLAAVQTLPGYPREEVAADIVPPLNDSGDDGDDE